MTSWRVRQQQQLVFLSLNEISKSQEEIRLQNENAALEKQKMQQWGENVTSELEDQIAELETQKTTEIDEHRRDSREKLDELEARLAAKEEEFRRAEDELVVVRGQAEAEKDKSESQLQNATCDFDGKISVLEKQITEITEERDTDRTEFQNALANKDETDSELQKEILKMQEQKEESRLQLETAKTDWRRVKCLRDLKLRQTHLNCYT